MGSDLIHGGDFKVPAATDGKDTADYSRKGPATLATEGLNFKIEFPTETYSGQRIIRLASDRNTDVDRLVSIEKVIATRFVDTFKVSGTVPTGLDLLVDGGANALEAGATGPAMDKLDFSGRTQAVYLGTSTKEAEAVEVFSSFDPMVQLGHWMFNVFVPIGAPTGSGVEDPTGLRFTNFESVTGSAHDDVMNLWRLNPNGPVSAADELILNEAKAKTASLSMTPAQIAEAYAQARSLAGTISQNQKHVEIHGGDGKDVIVGTRTGRVEIHGGQGKDNLTAGGFTSVLRGGEDEDTLVGGGFYSELHGGAGKDTFVLANNAVVKDATTEDFNTWGGIFALTGGVAQWWMEDGYAYWTPFMSMVSGAPLPMLGSIGLIGAILDAPLASTFRYAVTEANELVIQFARGRGGQAIIENYGLNLSSGIGSGNITVFQQYLGEGSIAGLTQYMKLALRAGFGLSGQGSDPLILDLDGDGLELTTAEGGVHFDLNADGFAERMGWTRGGDGFLVRDLNNNGTVDGLNELFGDATTSGFTHLGTYDANGDGRISALDAGFSSLRVWVDADQDGVTDAGELRTLGEAGIASISLSTTTGTTVSGHQVRGQSLFTRTNGTTSKISDVVLGNVAADTVWRGDATISAAAAAEAGLKGYGRVVDLRIAMTDDPTLLTLVQGFGALPTTTAWAALLADAATIAYRWAGVDDEVVRSLGGGAFDTRKLAFLETYLGTTLAQRAANGSIVENNLQELIDAWDGVLSKIAIRLAIQGPMESVFATTVQVNHAQDAFLLKDAGSLGTIVKSVIASLPAGSEGAAWTQTWGPLLSAFLDGAQRHDGVEVRTDYVVQALVQARDGFASPLSLQDMVTGLRLGGVRIGGAAADSLSRGTAEGMQVYVGGEGADSLTGGRGQDVYVFGRGFGHDTINDAEALESGDRIRLAVHNADDVTITRVGLDLVIQINGTTDRITVKNQFSTPVMHMNGMQLSPDYGIEDIQFADGTIWQAGEIAAAIGRGTSGADTIVGTGIADELEGGAGDDVLRGGDSGDLYYYSRGDGHDVIEDEMANPLLKGADVLLFLGGIGLGDLRFARDGASVDLTINFAWGGDSVRIKDQFAYSPLGFGTDYAIDDRVEALMFVNGIGMSWKDIQSAVIGTYTTSGDDATYGYGTADQFHSSAGNDFLSGLDGGDTYRFGRGSGNDVIEDNSVFAHSIATALIGYDGWGANDVLIFGEGITFGDLTFTRQGSAPDLLITVAGSTDTLTIKGQFAHTSGDIFGFIPTMWFDRIETFRFANGTSVTYSDIIDIVTTGTAGDDSLYGVKRPDRLDGKAGNDFMVGGDDSDVYVFGRGYGSDAISDQQADPFTPGPDTVEFRSDVAFADIAFSRDGADLIVSIVGTTDVLRIIKQYEITETGPFGTQAFNRIERFVWTDGTVRTWSVIEAGIIAASKTTGDDLVLGTHFANVLDGGLGNDRLEGGNGADTYLFDAGGGHDVIRDEWSNILSGDGDTVVFGGGLLAANVTLERYGAELLDLRLSFASGETLSIEGQFFYTTINYPKNQIETFQFADATWSVNDLRLAYIAGRQTAGNDVVDGFHTNDVITGGAGDDILRGGDGSDTYVFGVGFGQDAIEESVGLVTYADRDVVRFGAGLNAADVVLTRNGDDLVIGFTGATDTLTIRGQFHNAAWFGGWRDIERIEFNDGTVWTDADLRVRLLEQASTSGADTIRGFYTADHIDGGAGNDLLRGAGGGDVYVFGKGSGQDRIEEGYGTVYEDHPDAIAFAAGVTPSEVGFSRVGDDLLITITGHPDTLTIAGQFGATSNLVELFRFANGVVYTAAQVAAGVLVSQSTPGNDVVTGTNINELIDGGAGNDILRGGDGSDTYVFEAGFGQDVIEESVDHVSIADADVVQFGVGLTLDRAMFSRSGDDLTISFTGATDTLTIRGQFAHGAWFPGHTDIETFRFDGGVTITDQEIRQRLIAQATTAGNDVISGFWGDDVIEGGAGDDILRGQGGGDVYVWGRGVGTDVIEDRYDTLYEDSPDSVRFLPNVTREDVTFKKVGNDLLISIAGQTETLTVKGHFLLDQNRVESFVFADGVVISEAQVDVLAVLSQATSGNDVISGTEGADVIEGRGGDDTLRGGDGEDRYVFNAGFGRDLIREGVGNVSISDRDTIEFGDDLTSDKAIISRVGDDLVIGFTGRTDQVRIEGQFSHEAWFPSWTDIEVVRFSDGVVWTDQEIRERLLAKSSTDGDEVVTGYFTSDHIKAGKGDDQLVGRGGGDTYVFERGDGRDVVRDIAAVYEEGDDTIVFGRSIRPDDVTFVKEGDNLRLLIAGGTDEILIESQFNVQHSGIEFFRFADGTVLSSGVIATRAIAALSTMGDDVITGTAAANILDGLAGQDDISGRSGADVYLFGRGSGSDVINDLGDLGSGALDEIRFKVGVTLSDLSLHRVANDLVIRINGTDDELVLKAQLTFSSNIIERFTFADGTVYTDAQMTALLPPASPTTVVGTHRADVLVGTSGADVITGGLGADRIDGGFGGDTYVYASRDGSDLIDDSGTNTSQIDILRLTDLNASQIYVTRTDRDMLITVMTTGAVIEINDFITYGIIGHGIDQISFADGSSWSRAQMVASYAIRGTAGADVLNGTAGGDTFVALAGNDTIHGGEGSDTLILDAASTDVRWVRQADGSVQAIRVSTGEADTLTGVERVYFSGDRVTANLTDLVAAYGDAGDNSWLPGTAGDDFLYGNGGDDSLYGAAGNDRIDGGAGHDNALYAGAQSSFSLLRNADGSITVVDLVGNEGTDLLVDMDAFLFEDGTVWRSLEAVVGGHGTAGNDGWIEGTSGANRLYGLGGDDTLIGRGGDDRLDGGAGYDQADYVGASSHFTFRRRADGSIALVDTTLAEGEDTLVDMEAAYFQGDQTWVDLDHMVADYGTAGNDGWLEGTAGADDIYGLAGDDSLLGRGGNDRLFGGEGYDQAVYHGASTNFTFVRNPDGTVTVTDLTTGEGVDILDSVEAVYFDGDQTWMAIEDALGETPAAMGTGQFDPMSGNGHYRADVSFPGTNGGPAPTVTNAQFGDIVLTPISKSFLLELDNLSPSEPDGLGLDLLALKPAPADVEAFGSWLI